MPSESGDQKLLGNLRKLIDFVSADPNYNPANAKIKVPALEALYTSGLSATTDKNNKEAPYKVAVNTRQTTFAKAPSRAARAIRMAQASGASKPILDDLKTHNRKLTGQRKSKAPKIDPNAPAGQDGAGNGTHSTSQKSYDSQIGHVENIVALLGNIPSYGPHEEDLTIASLQGFVGEMRGVNDAVNTNFVPYSQARSTRDVVLYTGEDSVVNIALLVKAYVSAAFGRQSPLYKAIKGLTFHRQGKTA